MGARRLACSNLAQSLARQGADAFAATDCALLGLAERVETERRGGNDAIDPAARERLQKWMAMQGMTVPRLHALIVADERGFSLASDSSVVSGPQSYVAQVTYLRAHPNGPGYVSQMEASGRHVPAILVSRRIDRADGTTQPS